MPNVLSGRFRTGSSRPLQTFAPGQCIRASAIMQFRRNVYEYSTKKLRPSLPYAKCTRRKGRRERIEKGSHSFFKFSGYDKLELSIKIWFFQAYKNALLKKRYVMV